MRSRRCGGSSAAISSATSCATTPSAGSRPPSTMPAAASSAPSIRASTASATSTTRTPRSTIGGYIANPDHKSIPCARCRSTTGTASSITRTGHRRAAQSLRHRPLRRTQDPSRLCSVDRAQAAEPRHRRLDAAHAVRARDLQYAAGPATKAAPPSSAQVRNGGWPRSSIASSTRRRRTPLKQWAANHIWLAQRTGGTPCTAWRSQPRGVRQGGEGATVAEQFVLASAVNKPIILLPATSSSTRSGSTAGATSPRCGQHLRREADRGRGRAEPRHLRARQPGGRSPRPACQAELQEGLEAHAPTLAQRALANPVIRANALMLAARFGLREEMNRPTALAGASTCAA